MPRPPTKVVTHTRLPQKPTESGTKRKQPSAHPPRPRNNQVRTTSHHKHGHLRPPQGRGPTSRTTPDPRHTTRTERTPRGNHQKHGSAQGQTNDADRD
ncbi:hypothetical protein Taro_035507 [Colocasia esculenta]|uniref:Uncharacterized protein n=1 Tax=Colocasia esculenta TaxID=4460 RepID=A0A843W5X1_COLES|nr:hypothetical protein [Colocasia esculenta]